MKEIEVWTEINKALYEEKLVEFKKRFGEPRSSKRLAFRFGFNDNMPLNTRIRITDGKAEITQKVREDDNVAGRSEISTPLASDPQEILDMTNCFRNILACRKDETHFFMLQFQNNLWNFPDFELKLTNQKGNEDVYSYEIELAHDLGSEELNNKRLNEIARDLGVENNFEIKWRDNEFWVNYNKRVNIDIKDWKDEDILEVIKKYIVF